MRLTRLVKMLVRGPTGEMIWKEMRDLRLPSRGKKLSFKQNSLIAFAVFLSGFVYLQFQADFNPDSYWGKLYEKLSTDPARLLGLDQTQELPNLDPSSMKK